MSLSSRNRSIGSLIYWNEVDKGGHFAAWEERNSSLPRFTRHSDRCPNSRRVPHAANAALSPIGERQMSVLFTHRYLTEGGSGVALMDSTSPSATIGPQSRGGGRA